MNDDEAEARREICRIGKSLFDRGYAHGTAGNISVRLAGGGFLITPTDACLGFLDPDTLAKLDDQGEQVSGDRASKTIVLHRRIYEAAEPDTRCIVHTHSAHSVALTLAPRGPAARTTLPFMFFPRRPVDLLAPITPYFVMKVGHVPVIPYDRPGAPEVADKVAAAIAAQAARAPIRAVMLERLGPVVWHASPAAAMATLEELEETARLVLLARHPSNGAEPAGLGRFALDRLRRDFGARW